MPARLFAHPYLVLVLEAEFRLAPAGVFKPEIIQALVQLVAIDSRGLDDAIRGFGEGDRGEAAFGFDRQFDDVEIAKAGNQAEGFDEAAGGAAKFNVNRSIPRRFRRLRIA